MGVIDELEDIADQMAMILSRFVKDRDGLYIASGDEAKFTGLVLEARDMMNSALGPMNNFSRQLEMTRVEGADNWLGSQSYHSVENSIGIVRAAGRVLRRRATTPEINPASGATSSAPTYVALDRVNELRALPPRAWDLRRLVRLCEELNDNFSSGNYLASAMIVRAIADHVPPIFGASSFSHYASSVVERSHKKSMQNLQSSLRNIADWALHQQIRSKESLPNATQVDFKQDLDVLLGEVVRKLRP